MIIKNNFKTHIPCKFEISFKKQEWIYKLTNSVLTQKLQFINVIIRLKTRIFYNNFSS